MLECISAIKRTSSWWNHKRDRHRDSTSASLMNRTRTIVDTQLLLHNGHRQWRLLAVAHTKQLRQVLSRNHRITLGQPVANSLQREKYLLHPSRSGHIRSALQRQAQEENPIDAQPPPIVQTVQLLHTIIVLPHDYLAGILFWVAQRPFRGGRSAE